MNTVVDWPAIAEPTETLPALPTLREHSLAELNAVERGLAKLKAEHGSTDYDIATPHGYRLATTRRHAIRLVRYAVPKVVKAKRAELREISDAVAAEGERITAALQAIEDPHDKLITAEDERKAAEKAERERVEAERKARHEAGIATIRSYADRCNGLTSERIAAGIAQLDAIPITDSWEDFKERAELAKTATLARMVSLRDAAKAREDEAARLEAQRIENERIAAEQAAERERIAEAAAKVKADAEALQKRINEQAEREAEQARQALQINQQKTTGEHHAEETRTEHAQQLPEQSEDRRAGLCVAREGRAGGDDSAALGHDGRGDARTEEVGRSAGAGRLDGRVAAQELATGSEPAEPVAGQPGPVTFAEPEPADELSALRDMVRWAYSRLALRVMPGQDDALMLGRMKLYLEHGVIS